MSRLFAALVALLFAGSAHAILTLTANITHDQETVQGIFTTSTGAPRPQSFGTATFFLNDAQTRLSFVAEIFNIDVTGAQSADTFDNLSAAHIHGPAVPGTNGPVRWGFFGAPDNDNNPDDLSVVPFLNAVGGTISSAWDLPEGNNGTTLALQLQNILDGLTYINFHTVQFGGGEIRGQLLVVPEPSTLALLAACCVAVAIWAPLRRRRFKI